MNKRTPKFKQTAAFDAGKMLRSYLKKHRIYKSVLARMVNRHPQTLQGMLKKPSFQTAILWELSVALQHNFFADMAVALGIADGFENPLQTRVTELEKQNSDLQLQIKTLEKAIELMGRRG